MNHTKLLGALVLLLSVPAMAHFKLESPKSWWSQDLFGSPQKAPPCGGEGGGMASDAVTTVVAGQPVTISITETIYHPGHYRVVLGVDGQSSLPADPPVTAGTTACGSTVIATSPTFPLLADGQLVHTRALSGPQQFSVTIPAEVRCTNCVLQVVEFMSDHALNVPGGCFYHHCAVINVVAPDGGVPGTQDITADGGITTDAPSGGCGCQSTDGLALCMLALMLATSRRSLRNRRTSRKGAGIEHAAHGLLGVAGAPPLVELVRDQQRT